MTRFKNWYAYQKDGTFKWTYPCQGAVMRCICIFGIGDLSLLVVRPELFANKFVPETEYLAYDCMEELYFNKTRKAYVTGNVNIDLNFYKNLEFVKNKIV